jgi:hypothetical protein
LPIGDALAERFHESLLIVAFASIEAERLLIPATRPAPPNLQPMGSIRLVSTPGARPGPAPGCTADWLVFGAPDPRLPRENGPACDLRDLLGRVAGDALTEPDHMPRPVQPTIEIPGLSTQVESVPMSRHRSALLIISFHTC